jgi:hypothetical protein
MKIKALVLLVKISVTLQKMQCNISNFTWWLLKMSIIVETQTKAVAAANSNKLLHQ